MIIKFRPKENIDRLKKYGYIMNSFGKVHIAKKYASYNYLYGCLMQVKEAIITIMGAIIHLIDGVLLGVLGVFIGICYFVIAFLPSVYIEMERKNEN